MRKLYQIIIVLILIGNIAFAKTPDSILKPESYIKLNYDNDFFSATDRYYTQGIQFRVINRFIKYSPFSYALIPLNKHAKNYYGINIEQDCFTPKSIRYDTINYLERPFAATAFVSHFLISLDAEKKQSLETQLDLGVIGPCARCEDEQKAIHKALVNIRPLGWEAQIAADYIINYRAKYEKAIIYTKYAELMANVAVRAGTLYTDGAVGIHARVGLFTPYFKNLGLEKNGAKKFKLFLVVKANARAVGYNATMQGGVFNTNSMFTVPTGDISRFVYDGMAGVILAIHRTSFEYSRYYITPEFVRGVDHGWGRVAITVCF